MTDPTGAVIGTHGFVENPPAEDRDREPFQRGDRRIAENRATDWRLSEGMLMAVYGIDADIRPYCLGVPRVNVKLRLLADQVNPRFRRSRPGQADARPLDLRQPAADGGQGESGRQVNFRGITLLSFRFLACAVTWLLWTPMILAGVPAHSPRPVISRLSTGCSVVGRRCDRDGLRRSDRGHPGPGGVRRLLQRLACWKDVGVRWYLVALLLIPLGEVLIAGGHQLRCAAGVDSRRCCSIRGVPNGIFVFGPLFGETGWRFALPRMQRFRTATSQPSATRPAGGGWHFFLYAPGGFTGSLNGAGRRGDLRLLHRRGLG